MSNLSAFLNPVTMLDTQEIVISNRFVQRTDKGEAVLDEAGKPVPVPFKIRAITQEENEAIAKRSYAAKMVDGKRVEEFDHRTYSRRIVVAATVEPDFANVDLCAKFGVKDPELVPGKMLYSGEFSKLFNAIEKLSGFGDNLNEAAKN